MVYKIRGKVVETESGKGIAGLVVKAIDKDFLFDDLLGATVTDNEGRFEITYEEEDFRDVFEKNPDIVMIIKNSDRSRTLYRSAKPFRFPKEEEAYFDIKISSRILNEQNSIKENQMAKEREIGKITLEINPEQLKTIVQSGRLEAFVEAATKLFNRDLKAELVRESVSSISTQLLLFDDDEYGTGPRPPHWWNIGKIDSIIQRLDIVEKAIGINEDILNASQLGKTRGI